MSPVAGQPSYSELEAAVDDYRHRLAAIIGLIKLDPYSPSLLTEIRDLCYEGLAYVDTTLVEGLHNAPHRGSRAVHLDRCSGGREGV